MAEPTGTNLRALRMALGWSQQRLARMAGVSKSTISQWESGARQPRVVELAAALEALSASPTQCARAFADIEAPRALRHLRSETANAGLGPPPTAGDILRSLRLRRGQTQEQVAAQVGVVRNAVARWELGERLPSSQHMQTLCYVLKAGAEEYTALTANRFAEPLEEPSSWDEREAGLRERLTWHHLVRWEEAGGRAEMEYLILERKAWRLATQDERGRPLLAQIFAFHAEAMRNRERWHEAGSLARRALSLVPRQEREPDFALRAAVMVAAAATYGGSRPAPLRGFDLLQPWLAHSPYPSYTAWILSELAGYMAAEQGVEAARTLARRACQIAQQCDDPTELYLRRVDYSRTALEAGRPGEALEAMPAFLWTNSYAYVRRTLILAEAHQRLGHTSEAHDGLQNAYTMMQTYGHERLRVTAEGLARKF